jgi:hypothetical protein
MHEPGTRKEIVDMEHTVDEAGELIECAEKSAKEAGEERKSASTTDGPEEGI